MESEWARAALEEGAVLHAWRMVGAGPILTRTAFDRNALAGTARARGLHPARPRAPRHPESAPARAQPRRRRSSRSTLAARGSCPEARSEMLRAHVAEQAVV